MRRRVPPAVLLLAGACGDGGPEIERFEGAWRLTSVNILPLPAPGSATAGEVWAAGILQITGETGTFDRCMQDPSTSTRISRPTALLVTSSSGDQFTLEYFDRRSGAPDTATVAGTQVTLRYRNTLSGQEGLDVLGFVPLAGPIPEACSLAP